MYEISNKKVLSDARRPIIVDARHLAQKERVGQLVTTAPNEYTRSPGQSAIGNHAGSCRIW